jgi:hypothetical protein
MSTEPGYDTAEFDLDLDDEDYFPVRSSHIAGGGDVTSVGIDPAHVAYTICGCSCCMCVHGWHCAPVPAAGVARLFPVSFMTLSLWQLLPHRPFGCWDSWSPRRNCRIKA